MSRKGRTNFGIAHKITILETFLSLQTANYNTLRSNRKRFSKHKKSSMMRPTTMIKTPYVCTNTGMLYLIWHGDDVTKNTAWSDIAGCCITDVVKKNGCSNARIFLPKKQRRDIVHTCGLAQFSGEKDDGGTIC